VAALVTSCSTDSSLQPFAGRDSLGTAIAETLSPTLEWRLSPEPVLQIGVVDGEEAYQFSSIAFAGRLSDGRMVVVDRRSFQIRFFDRAGKHTSTIGRRGAGPGEFRGFADVILTGDSLLVYDANNRRLSLIGPDATVIAEESVRDHPAFTSTGLGHTLIGLTPDGRMVIALPRSVSPPPLLNSAVYTRDTVAIVISARHGRSVDTIAMIPSAEYIFEGAASTGRAGWVRRGASFGYYPHFALGPDGMAYATGEHAGFEVMRLSRSDAGSRSHPILIVRRTDVRPLLVQQVVDRYLGWIADLVRAQGGSNAGPAIARARAALDALPRDHLVPFIDAMVADAESRIWQRIHLMGWEQESTPRTWIVHSHKGHAVARISIPWNLRITQIQADHIVGVTRNEADIPFVTVHRIIR
jgi:hypothetical protein